jgi:hypothetical protein
MFVLHRFLRLVAPLMLAAAALGCQEDLRGGAACPGLCPEQAIDMRDTVLTPLVTDTTLIGYPPPGGELAMLLSLRPDTVETAIVLRFDRVPTRYAGFAQPEDMTGLDSISLVLNLGARVALDEPLTIQVFDVDTLAADLDFDAVRATLRPDRLLTTLEFEAGDTINTPLRIALPVGILEEKILDSLRVRLGLRLQTNASVDLRVLSSRTASLPTLAVGAALPSGPVSASVGVISATPPNLGPVIPALADYTLVLQGSPPPPANTLVVGGLPGRRVFMRFDFPAGLLETTTVVRAELLLTQIANDRAGATDSVRVLPRAVLAHPRLEPDKAALLISEPGALNLVATFTRPSDSGPIAVDIAQLARQWGALDTLITQRSLVLQAGEEGLSPQEIHFHSSAAADPALRPRLRLTYVPRPRFGLP